MGSVYEGTVLNVKFDKVGKNGIMCGEGRNVLYGIFRW